MPTVIDLLHELTAGPDLRGAACVAERDVFDMCLERGVAGRVYELAIRICAQCPALAPCADWIDSLPLDERPYGVTAGQIRYRGRTP